MRNPAGYFTLFLAAALSLRNGARADAQTTASLVRVAPVHVTSCKVGTALLSTDVDQPAALVAGQLWFTLENVQAEPATEVTLRIRYGGVVRTLLERGVFSTGTRIERTSNLMENAPWVGTTPDACTVVSVRFANGTAWLPASDRPQGSG